MLLDSSSIIYAAMPEHLELRQFIADNTPFVSAISYVEVLGYHRLTPRDMQHFRDFFRVAPVLPLSDDVLAQAVRLRQQRKMSLGDSLMAGTALEYGLRLVTHNTEDFDWVDGLPLVDPLGQPPHSA